VAIGMLLVGSLAHSQDEQVVTAKLERYSIAALVMHAEGVQSFKHRGNFLVRSRRHWLDEETLVAVLDAPSDEWATFSQDFGATARYGSDVAAVLKQIPYNVQEWTFVGTSEGSISAFHVARMKPQLARRTILTSSLFASTPNGRGLSNAKFGELAAPLLWVHHEDDPCRFTSYRDAKTYAERTRSPLVTVRGGEPEKGGACAKWFWRFVPKDVSP
jgi:predicted esterase